METRQTKPYSQPAMDVVELETRVPLLANTAQNNGYGTGVGEGSGAWHDAPAFDVDE
ncbi:MAG: hypothetical protein II822_06375 [Prevotella sp.]|nr:hypothetical protein [Prevotella sp.]